MNHATENKVIITRLSLATEYAVVAEIYFSASIKDIVAAKKVKLLIRDRMMRLVMFPAGSWRYAQRAKLRKATVAIKINVILAVSYRRSAATL